MKILSQLAFLTVIHTHTAAPLPAKPYFMTPVPLAVPLQINIAPIASLQPIAPPPPVSYPVAPQGTYANTYDWGNCTAYVAGRKQVPNSWGNATTWADRATAQGITVSDIPLVGSIAQESKGLGHVAIVIGISPGQVEVSEMNVRGLGVVDNAWYPISSFRYIYV